MDSLEFTEAGILGLRDRPRLSEIEIGGINYPLGLLDDDRLADIARWGERLQACHRSGTTPRSEDLDIARQLRHLLETGDPEFRWDSVKDHVSGAHYRAAAFEVMRQAVCRELDPARAAGRA